MTVRIVAVARIGRSILFEHQRRLTAIDRGTICIYALYPFNNIDTCFAIAKRTKSTKIRLVKSCIFRLKF